MRAGMIGAMLALLSLGCSSTDSADETFVVRDSVGIRVVDSRAGAWGSGPGFLVGEAPELRVGAIEGEEPYRFYRIADATRLSDGRILVGDGGSGQVRTFGPDGVHQWSAGGLGDAPGEFRSITSLEVMGDEVTVFDRGTSRLTTFSLTGDFVGTTPVSMFAGTTPMAAGSVRFLSTGRAYGMDATTLAGGAPPALVRDTAFVFEILAPDEGTPELVTSVPGMWTQHVELGGRPGYRPQPLTSEPSWDAHGTDLYITSGEAFEFRVVNADGRISRMVHRTETPPTVTEQDAQSWRDAMIAPVPEAQRPMMTEMLAAFTMPEHLPVYAALLVDPEGCAWLRRYVAPGIRPGRDWDVYSAEGAYLGAVRTPPGLGILEIGTGYVLGTWTDDMDIEYIEIYRLSRVTGRT
jgi:hypothetical protein